MNPQDLHETVSYAPTEQLVSLADKCLKDVAVRVSYGPETALVMVRVQDAVDGEVFNLGEVLVTRCELTLDGERGWGTVLGDDPERALCAAVLDASARRCFSDGIERDLELLLAHARETRRERWAGVQQSRVEFEERAL